MVPQMGPLAQWCLVPKQPRVVRSWATIREPVPGLSLPPRDLAVEAGPGAVALGARGSPHRQQAVHVDLPRQQPQAGHATAMSFLKDPALLPPNPVGLRAPQQGAGCPRSSPVGPLSHHQGYHPNRTSSSSTSSSRTGAGMVSWRADTPLRCWTDMVPSFCPCKHLSQESNAGMFPGCLQALDILPHQDVLQDLRVPGAAVPTSHPMGTDPWLFTTMKTLLECPSCSKLVP